MSGRAAELQKLEIERRMGITPEVKALQRDQSGRDREQRWCRSAIFLFVFMQAIADM
jgi:hypothetical protein